MRRFCRTSRPCLLAVPHLTSWRQPLPTECISNSARQISLNPVNWFKSKAETLTDDTSTLGKFKSKIGQSTNPNLEDELPEIFANQPVEVDDYIRPEQSFFERLEDYWDYFASFLQPMEKQVSIMRGWHNDGVFGIYDAGGWGSVFVIYGFVLRCITLIPAFYSNRNALRMSHINPQIGEFTNGINKTKNDKSLSSAEKRIITDGYKRMKTSLMKKHKCASWKNFVTALTGPVTVTAFMGISQLASYEADVAKTPFLWVKDISIPDPTWGLPILCASMFYINFVLNQSMNSGTRSNTTVYIRWGIRVGLVGFVYFMAESQPAAMFAYWIGLSIAGIMQPLLLRYQPFRDLFNFPDPPQVAKDKIMGGVQSTVKGPSLYERVFASKEEKAKLEAERQEKRAQLSAQQFQKIDDFDVVFDNDIPRPKK